MNILDALTPVAPPSTACQGAAFGSEPVGPMPHTAVRAHAPRHGAARRAKPDQILVGEGTGDLDHQVTPLKAWALILPAFICFSLLDASAKWVVLAGFAPLFVTWCRFFFHIVIILVALRSWSHLDLLVTRHPFLQIGRGALLACGTFTNFMALQHLQLAETMAFFLASPMVITALAGPLLGEWAGWRRWTAVLVGFAGVLIVARPGTEAFQWPVLWSLASLMCASLYFVVTRMMTATETDESMIVYSGLVPAVLLSPVVFLYGEWPGFSLDLLLLVSLGVYGSVGHLFVIKAHRIAPAPSIAPAVFSQVIWMMALGLIVFGQWPDGWTLVGIAVIVASGLYILNRERLLSHEAESDAPAAEVAETGRE